MSCVKTDQQLSWVGEKWKTLGSNDMSDWACSLRNVLCASGPAEDTSEATRSTSTTVPTALYRIFSVTEEMDIDGTIAQMKGRFKQRKDVQTSVGM